MQQTIRNVSLMKVCWGGEMSLKQYFSTNKHILVHHRTIYTSNGFVLDTVSLHKTIKPLFWHFQVWYVITFCAITCLNIWLNIGVNLEYTSYVKPNYIVTWTNHIGFTTCKGSHIEKMQSRTVTYITCVEIKSVFVNHKKIRQSVILV